MKLIALVIIYEDSLGYKKLNILKMFPKLKSFPILSLKLMERIKKSQLTKFNVAVVIVLLY